MKQISHESVHHRAFMLTKNLKVASFQAVKSFSFIIADPDFKADHKEVDFETIYAAEDIINIEDEEELRRVLEELPCCVSNENGGLAAEPLNVVIIGAIDDWTTAFDEIH